jgi:hypothetical protein
MLITAGGLRGSDLINASGHRTPEDQLFLQCRQIPMIRGWHIDLSIFDAMQVAERRSCQLDDPACSFSAMN